MMLSKFLDPITTLLSSTFVKDIMSDSCISLGPNDTVAEAVELMNNHNISSILIVEDNKPRGIVTERDLVQKVMHKKKKLSTKLSGIMSTSLITSKSNMTIYEASQLMKKNNIRQLVVLDDKSGIGVITQTDIIQKMNNIFMSWKELMWNPVFLVIILSVIAVSFVVNILVAGI